MLLSFLLAETSPTASAHRHIGTLAHQHISTSHQHINPGFKHKVHAHYTQLVRDRIDAFRDMLNALSEGARNDAKSSAGDKHETALSMVHLEQEKINGKLAENFQLLSVLEKISPDGFSARIAAGSLIAAGGIFLFLSAALPKATVEGFTVIALSPQSPLGRTLLGQEAGFSFKIGNKTYVIDAIA